MYTYIYIYIYIAAAGAAAESRATFHLGIKYVQSCNGLRYGRMSAANKHFTLTQKRPSESVYVSTPFLCFHTLSLRRHFFCE